MKKNITTIALLLLLIVALVGSGCSSSEPEVLYEGVLQDVRISAGGFGAATIVTIVFDDGTAIVTSNGWDIKTIYSDGTKSLAIHIGQPYRLTRIGGLLGKYHYFLQECF